MNLSHVVPLQFTLFTCKSCLHRLVDDSLMFEFGLPFHPSFHHCRLWLHGSNWPSGRSADRQISRGRTRGERMGKVSGGVFISFIFQHLSIPGTFQVLWLWSILCHRVYRSGVIKAMHVLKSDTEPSWKSKVNSRHMTFWPNNRCNQVNPWQDAPSFSIARISWTNSSEPYVDCTSSGSRISSSWSFRRESGWVSKNWVIKPLARLWFLLFILVLEYVSLYWNSLQYRFFIREIYWCDDMSIRLCDEIFWAIPTMPHSMHVHSSIVFAALCCTARNHQQILPCRYSAWWSRDERVQ